MDAYGQSRLRGWQTAPWQWISGLAYLSTSANEGLGTGSVAPACGSSWSSSTPRASLFIACTALNDSYGIQGPSGIALICRVVQACAHLPIARLPGPPAQPSARYQPRSRDGETLLGWQGWTQYDAHKRGMVSRVGRQGFMAEYHGLPYRSAAGRS